MVLALWTIGVLMFFCIIILQKFMRDMAKIEKDLIEELKEIKGWLIKINGKQL